jgi:hypothetical protein
VHITVLLLRVWRSSIYDAKLHRGGWERGRGGARGCRCRARAAQPPGITLCHTFDARAVVALAPCAVHGRKLSRSRPGLFAEVNKRQQILDDLQQENQDLHKLSEQLPQELAVLEGKVAEEQEKAKLQHQALEQSDALRNDNRSVLELGHELYQKRLGLKVPHPAQLTCDLNRVPPAACSAGACTRTGLLTARAPRAVRPTGFLHRISYGTGFVVKWYAVRALLRREPGDQDGQRRPGRPRARILLLGPPQRRRRPVDRCARPPARRAPRAARIASTTRAARVRAAARDPQRGAAAVRECVPMVDGLQALVDELNTTNSLSLLVRAVRQQWRRQVGA